MNRFEYIRPTDDRRGGCGGGRAGRGLSGGRHQSARPDEGRRHAARSGWSTSRGLPGLDRIEWLPDGGVRIGALVRNADLAHDAELRASLSGRRRSAALRRVGAASQCRDGRRQPDAAHALRLFPGHRRAPATSASRARAATRASGENRLHAVLGWSEDCIATHPSDFCVPLVALDAVVEIEGQGGRREIAARRASPPARRQHRERETALAPGELIVALRLPADAAAFPRNARYLKLRERTSYAFAVVSAAAALELDGGTSPGRASRSAGSPRSRGARGRRKLHCRACGRPQRPSRMLPI